MIRAAARAAAAGSCAAVLALAGCAGAQNNPAATPAAPRIVRTDTVALRRVLDSIAAAHKGVLGYSVTNLETGEHLELRGNETFPTASLIKVSVLVTVFDLAEKGMLNLTDPITMLKIDQVGGSGVLQFMKPGMTLTISDAAALMMILSDNTATNLLVDRVLPRRVWQKMESLGLNNTKIHGRSMTALARVAVDSAEKYGLGVTTPNEMAKLFELMAQGKAVSPKADSAMLALMQRASGDELLMRFAGGVRAAHKAGQTNQVRTECALFYLSGRVVTCVMTKENADTRWIIDNEAQLSLARFGEAVVKAWAVPRTATGG